MWKTGLLLASGPDNINRNGEERIEFLKKAMRQQPEQVRFPRSNLFYPLSYFVLASKSQFCKSL